MDSIFIKLGCMTSLERFSCPTMNCQGQCQLNWATCQRWVRTLPLLSFCMHCSSDGALYTPCTSVAAMELHPISYQVIVTLLHLLSSSYCHLSKLSCFHFVSAAEELEFHRNAFTDTILEEVIRMRLPDGLLNVLQDDCKEQVQCNCCTGCYWWWCLKQGNT